MTSAIAASELSKHDKKDDVWISVNGIVYNMTEFAPEHPGGAESKPKARPGSDPANRRFNSYLPARWS